MSIFNYIGLAMAPVVVLITLVYFNDKHEREPFWMLLFAFAMGMVSVVPAYLLEVSYGNSLIGVNNHNWPSLIGYSFLIVGFSEEFSKFIFLRWIFYRRKDFNEPYDGIMYTMMIGMGFAFVENLLYILSAPSFPEAVSMAKLRAITAVPAHATFAILMGYFAGRAKFSKNSYPLLVLGLLSAVLFHGSYDLFLFQKINAGIVGGAFVSLVIGIILSIRAIRAHQQSSPFNE